jgi:hypothetical protein
MARTVLVLVALGAASVACGQNVHALAIDSGDARSSSSNGTDASAAPTDSEPPDDRPGETCNNGTCPAGEPDPSRACTGPLLCEYRDTSSCSHVYSCLLGSFVRLYYALPIGPVLDDGGGCSGLTPSWLCNPSKTSTFACLCNLTDISHPTADEAGSVDARCNVCPTTIPALGTPCTQGEQPCSYQAPSCGGARIYCGACGVWVYSGGSNGAAC